MSMTPTPTKARGTSHRTTGVATAGANQRTLVAARQVPPRATRRWTGRRRLLAGAVVIGLAMWLGSWVVAAATVLYGAHLRSTGWTWARVALHLVGAAVAVSLAVFVATTYGRGPGLLAAVVVILVWRWDRDRPLTVRAAAPEPAAEVDGVDLETQLGAAFAEGFLRGQRELKKVRKASERSVPAFDPDDPDSF